MECCNKCRLLFEVLLLSLLVFAFYNDNSSLTWLSSSVQSSSSSLSSSVSTALTNLRTQTTTVVESSVIQNKSAYDALLQRFLLLPSNTESLTTTTTTTTTRNEEDATTTKATTIIVQLSGEMGNHLCHLAHALGVSLWLQQEYNTSSKIILKHQTHGKWVTGRYQLQDAFLFARSLDFEPASFNETTTTKLSFETVLKEQKEKLGTALDGINDPINNMILHPAPVDASLKALMKAKREQEQQQQTARKADGGAAENEISLPFLVSNTFSWTDVMVDRYLEEYRILFQMDPSKCQLVPDPDEHVFHFRNFLHEMPRNGKRLGFAELGPNQTARDLFGHLQHGDKVAIVSRFDSEKYVQPYVDAFERRGLQTRVIRGQTDTQDFCFLRHAQASMTGIVLSPYFVWAALLNPHVKTILAYSVDSQERQAQKGKRGPVFRYYNWTHPDLQDRFLFSSHTPDAEADPENWKRR